MKKIENRQFGFRKKRSIIDTVSKIITKIFDKVNREKKFEQLENMRIQGRRLEFIRELINERWIKVRVGGSISHSK